ncbi:hypothetical protein JTT02_08860 [Clostridium botulinum]|nr:hypothetical protein [Clostridium botulinum]MCS4446419.1 hypothetical protein [Clostridium botulinum]MCS4460440.1 hypothetical protein [Clostridium botulinum]MCS4514888.1 hypothetical protein [Clostridium botulinum]MCS4519145.1 hypothetical protein [Clostridium botulinum]
MNFRKANANDVNELVLLFKNLQAMHSENVTNIFNKNIDECILKEYINNVILNEDYNFYIVEDKKR